MYVCYMWVPHMPLHPVAFGGCSTVSFDRGAFFSGCSRRVVCMTGELPAIAATAVWFLLT